MFLKTVSRGHVQFEIIREVSFSEFLLDVSKQFFLESYQKAEVCRSLKFVLNRLYYTFERSVILHTIIGIPNLQTKERNDDDVKRFENLI